jgi:hypothetical protein
MDFRILQELAPGTLRFADRVVDTHIVDDVAHLAVTKTKGVTNPLHILTFGQIDHPAFRPALWESTADRVLRGTGASAFDDAVEALHNLGARHGVDGIALGTNPNVAGSIKLSGSRLYTSDAVAPEVAMRIDKAARRVLEFLDAPR